MVTVAGAAVDLELQVTVVDIHQAAVAAEVTTWADIPAVALQVVTTWADIPAVALQVVTI
jgi:hypothetical protein